MLLQSQVPSTVWELLEQLYLESGNKQGIDDYAKQSETEKHATLLAFADAQATVSKRWAAIVTDLRIVGVAG